ncbi:MAG: hypothetical protein ACRYG7_17460 [Janthinobacterium lividum]
MRTILPAPAASASFTPVDLDKTEASFFVHALAQGPEMPPAQLLIDCGRLRCLRHLGVSYVVSQLLVLHQSGARVWLCNVDPLLHRCLRLLRLDALFLLA